MREETEGAKPVVNGHNDDVRRLVDPTVKRLFTRISGKKAWIVRQPKFSESWKSIHLHRECRTAPVLVNGNISTALG